MWAAHVVCGAHVVTQIGAVEESLAAHLALVGPVAGVTVQVVTQVRGAR